MKRIVWAASIAIAFSLIAVFPFWGWGIPVIFSLAGTFLFVLFTGIPQSGTQAKTIAWAVCIALAFSFVAIVPYWGCGDAMTFSLAGTLFLVLFTGVNALVLALFRGRRAIFFAGAFDLVVALLHIGESMILANKPQG